MQFLLSINFLPNAVYQAATCLRATLAAARRVGFPTEQLMFEIVEHEQPLDRAYLKHIFVEYQRQGFVTALDDFGAGYSGLLMLADLRPDVIKLDMELVRGIDSDLPRQTIVSLASRSSPRAWRRSKNGAHLRQSACICFRATCSRASPLSNWLQCTGRMRKAPLDPLDHMLSMHSSSRAGGIQLSSTPLPVWRKTLERP